MKTFAIAAALLVAACSAERDARPVDAPETAGSDRGGPAARTAAPAPASAPSPTPVATDEAAKLPAAANPKVAVDGEGLRLVDPVSGSSRPLPFGTPRAQLLQALAFRGPPGLGTYPDCGNAAYAGWPDGLTLVFKKDRFAGWGLDERANGGLTTMSGVGPGKTRDALEDAYQAEVRQSSLGTEFTAGGLAGVLDGQGRRAEITNMWAGEVCIAR